MKLISLNVNGANRQRALQQVKALAAYGPDLVALQEVAVGRVGDYRSALQDAGWEHSQDSMGAGQGRAGLRSAGVLVASRWECAPLADATRFSLPWPERLLAVLVDTPWGPLELHSVYIPADYKHKPAVAIRIATLRALYGGLATTSDRPRIVCGDFNMPQRETPDGHVITFGQTIRKDGRLRIRDRALDEAERLLLPGLAAFGLVDVYRTLHGYAHEAFSWYTSGPDATGFRPDHVLASPSLRPVTCRYLHDFRAVRPDAVGGLGFRRLSDHAALEVVFDPAPPV